MHIRDLPQATNEDKAVVFWLAAFLKDLALYTGLPEEQDIRLAMALAAALLCCDYMPKDRRPINLIITSKGLMDLLKQHGAELHR